MPYDEWLPVHAVKFNSDGTVDLMNEASCYEESEMHPLANQEKFIAEAIQHPGALHRQLGIPKGEKIPVSELRAAAKAPGKLGKRARFALMLRGLHHHHGPLKNAMFSGAEIGTAETWEAGMHAGEAAEFDPHEAWEEFLYGTHEGRQMEETYSAMDLDNAKRTFIHAFLTAQGRD
jgi:hypothetical protein